MRAIKFLLFSAILLLVITSASAKSVHLYVDVKNSQSPYDPVNGAQVTVSRAAGDTWTRTTTAQGRTSPSIDLNLALTNHEFNVAITAPGFQSKNYNNLIIRINSIEEDYIIVSASLDPTGLNCNNNGTCDPSESQATCPSDCAPKITSGLIKDVQLVTPSSGQSNAVCPTGYVDKGSFYGTGAYNIQHKLCINFTDISRFSQGSQYITTIYLNPKGVTKDDCEEGDIPMKQFSAGLTFSLCVGKANINDISKDQYSYDVVLSQNSICTSAFNKQSGPLRDINGLDHIMCTAIQNYDSAAGCNLTEPKWLNTALEEQTSVAGWIAENDYDYAHGIKDLFLYVKADGCRYDTVKFEVWEGPSENPSNGDKKFTLSPAVWLDSGYKYYLWKPEWFEKSGPGLNSNSPRYYSFRAVVDGATRPIESPFSKTLTVNKPNEAECHYSKDSTADDEACHELKGPAFTCADDNTCQDISCSTDDDCEIGFCSSNKCVECMQDSHCIQSATYGEGYICDISPDSENYHTCIYNQECSLKNLRWQSESGNDLDLTRSVAGWINSAEYRWGDKLNMMADAEGCKNIGGIVFVLLEKDGLISLKEDELPALSTIHTADYRIFTHQGFTPPWEITWENLVFGEGNEFEYYFYAASADDPNTKLSVADSPILKVKKPEAAECTYSKDSEEDDEVCTQKYGTGMRCDQSNTCKANCKTNAECAPDQICATSATLGQTGWCYDCFTDSDCSTNEICSGQPNFLCLECKNSSDCDVEDGEFCLSGKCEKRCSSNEDCTSLLNKSICEPEKKICVACLTTDDCSTGFCQEEKNECVECLKNKDCGFGKHCDLETYSCANGPGEGALKLGGGLIIGLVGAFAGFMFAGPMGAMIGGLLGMLFGVGFGGGAGGLGGLMGGFG